MLEFILAVQSVLLVVALIWFINRDKLFNDVYVSISYSVLSGIAGMLELVLIVSISDHKSPSHPGAYITASAGLLVASFLLIWMSELLRERKCEDE